MSCAICSGFDEAMPTTRLCSSSRSRPLRICAGFNAAAALAASCASMAAPVSAGSVKSFTPVTLAVYARGDEHLAPGSRAEPEGPQRARLADVEALLRA